jgi:CheY-like chemotaxis protein
MDATRTRRTHDPARQRWYAFWRSLRFARLGALELEDAMKHELGGPVCGLAGRQGRGLLHSQDWAMDYQWPSEEGAATVTEPLPRRVFLVDDSEEFLDSATHFLTADPKIEIVGRASSGRGALEQVPVLKPDLVLMDLNMPEMNGLEATRQLKSQPDGPRVIILTLHDNPEYRAAAEAVQADGFVAKTELGLQLLPLIQELFA